MIQFEIEVHGRVQGVEYRYFVLHKANELGIFGWVKNRVDGSVLILAQGAEPVLNTFIDYLQIGPVRSRVDRITKFRMEILNEFDSFSVK